MFHILNLKKHDTVDGFTLLELIVVMGIIAATTTLAVSMLKPSQTGNRELTAIGYKIAATMRATRSSSIHKNLDTAFSIDLAKREYWSSANKKHHLIPGEISISLRTARSQVDHKSLGRIIFFASGSSSGGKLLLSRNSRTIAISVDWLTGFIKTEDTSNDRIEE